LIVTNGGGAPTLQCDNDNGVYCFCNSIGRIRFFWSTDNGTNWSDTEIAERYNLCHVESPRIPVQWADDNSFHVVFGDFVSVNEFDYEIYYVRVQTDGAIRVPRTYMSTVGVRNNFDFGRSLTAFDDTSILIGACQRMDWDWGDIAMGVPYTINATIMPTGAQEPTIATSILGDPTLWPNPTRGAASIRYRLERREPVRAAVYDVGGRLVKTLLAHPVEPGTHVLTWDGRTEVGQPATEGVYVLRVKAGESTWSRKVVVTK
jgi:hypothetical protein